MLVDDLTGKTPNKAASYRQLAEQIDRSVKAIEYKHQNISAVLKALGETWLTGLAPAFNFQRSFEDAVLRWMNSHPDWVLRAPAIAPQRPSRYGADLDRTAADAVEQAATAGAGADVAHRQKV